MNALSPNVLYNFQCTLVQNNLTLNKNINQVFYLILMYNVFKMIKSASLTKTVNTASALVQTLIELGVDSVFGYPGASVLIIYN